MGTSPAVPHGMLASTHFILDPSRDTFSLLQPWLQGVKKGINRYSKILQLSIVRLSSCYSTWLILSP